MARAKRKRRKGVRELRGERARAYRKKHPGWMVYCGKGRGRPVSSNFRYPSKRGAERRLRAVKAMGK
jgi:hypothetical protein